MNIRRKAAEASARVGKFFGQLRDRVRRYRASRPVPSVKGHGGARITKGMAIVPIHSTPVGGEPYAVIAVYPGTNKLELERSDGVRALMSADLYRPAGRGRRR